jgi:hypothetical protein
LQRCGQVVAKTQAVGRGILGDQLIQSGFMDGDLPLPQQSQRAGSTSTT